MKKNSKREETLINTFYIILFILLIGLMFVGFVIADNNMHKTNFFKADKILDMDNNNFEAVIFRFNKIAGEIKSYILSCIKW